MNGDPWTGPDPQPGGFDALIQSIDAQYVERHEGEPDARSRILLAVDGEDAERLERIAQARGKSVHDLVVELLREADRPAA